MGALGTRCSRLLAARTDASVLRRLRIALALGAGSAKTLGMDAFEGWEDPWEQIRLLADGPRNAALLRFLKENAPGKRLLEVGAAGGLLSCAAARLGAKRVIAVEASPLAEVARELVKRNGLQDIVRVEAADLLELEPDEEVDWAFAELANADPLIEGWVDVMEAAQGWLAPEGRLAPAQLRVRWALVEDSAGEGLGARAEVQALGDGLGLDVGPLLEMLRPAEGYRFLAPKVNCLHERLPVFSLDFGDGEEAPEETRITVPEGIPGATSAALFFEVDYAGQSLSNEAQPGHFGVLVSSFADELRPGETLRVVVDPDDDSMSIER